MTPRMGPDREEVEDWIELNLEDIEKRRKKIEAGRGTQGTYTGLYLDYMDLGRAHYLHGVYFLHNTREAVKGARVAFQKAAECMEMCFRMSYDPTLPEYLGENSDWCRVDEVTGIDGFNAALMASDFALARRFAPWPRRSPDDDPMDEEVCNYVDALQAYLLKDTMTATDLLHRNFELFDKHKARRKSSDVGKQEEAEEDRGWKTHYHTLSMALMGIVEKNEVRFNGGLAAQLELYEPQATHGEEQDTSEEFICDAAVALANLGLWAGMKLYTKHRLLPSDLLISTHNPISK